MLARTEQKSPAASRTATVPVSILSVATAVPPFKVSQAEISERALALSPQFAQFELLYSNTGIETRYACETREWYLEPHSWEERSEAFRRHATDLLERVATQAIDNAGLRVEDIDAIVVNTITGIAVPSLEALLMNRMPFRPDVERLPIFGFGCAGGVAGLSRAARLAMGMPGGNVLFLTVDPCTLCLRIDDPSIENFVASSLFADGAVGVVLRAEGRQASPGRAGTIVAMGEKLWPGTERILGWDMKHDGFGVVLSAQLPMLMRDELGGAVTGFLDRQGMDIGEMDGFLFHPGGRKILETVQKVFSLTAADLALSWNVLRDYGNMSAASVLFVLNEALAGKHRGRHFMTAFGPGFSAFFMVLDL